MTDRQKDILKSFGFWFDPEHSLWRHDGPMRHTWLHETREGFELDNDEYQNQFQKSFESFTDLVDFLESWDVVDE